MTEEGKPVIQIAARERGPGPGRYCLPSTLGSNNDIRVRAEPSFSFGLKLPNSIFQKSIGMGPKYNIEKNATRFGKDGTPAYSILGRPKDLQPFNTPSPYAYSPEKCHPQGEKHAPKYSMGARTRLRKNDQIPASNSYNLPHMIGGKTIGRTTQPSYSLRGRPTVGSYLEDMAKAPGPGSHSVVAPDVYRGKKPSYSMLGRNVMPGDNTQKPGPGAHSPEKVIVTKKAAPKYSIGSKHSEFLCPVIVPDVSD
ncbi:ciliary microtubule associated protein 1B-like [Amphiura filiformis]|uniref:ciliary microtubule associated protein 1B-like n=1 Tax=Amphiura filiformis TaxID=82378 RepID=UPI003B228DF7